MPSHRFFSSWTEAGSRPTGTIHLSNNSYLEPQEATATREESASHSPVFPHSAGLHFNAQWCILDVKGKLHSAACQAHLSCVGELGMSNAGASWAALVWDVLARFGLLGVGFGWIGMVWLVWGWFGLDCHILARFMLVWIVLGWFGSFWIVSGLDCSISSEPVPFHPPLPRATQASPAPIG